jgi:dephospho-CoA kinase
VARVVGLTGGIGSGKSEVSRAFAQLGTEVVDADVLAHEVTAPGAPGYDAVVAAFGPDVVAASGEIDRVRLRRQVFASADDRQRLEQALHPLIRAEAQRRVAGWRGPYGVLVVPLLFERGGLLPMIDRILVVDCPEPEQVRRVMARSGLTEPEVRAIMATQVERHIRLARADDVIDNGGAPAAIAPQVAELDRRYRLQARA